MALTPKQEKYVQGLVAGLSQRQAYIKAGYSSNNKTDNYLDVEASKLFANPKVSERYQDLMSEYKDRAIWTREKAEQALSWLLDKAKENLEEEGFRQANSTAFINAIKELNEIAVVYPIRERQIAKMDKEIIKDETAEDKLSSYLEVLGGAIDES